MSDEDNVTITNDLFISSIDFIPPIVKFWLYLVFLIPSFICTLFALYCILFDRILRHALNNHVIIVLLLTVLFYEVTVYPWMLYYHYNNDTWQRSYIFCNIWAFIDWTFYVMQIMIFAWASIERHILIFHDGWVSTTKKRFFAHYLPIIIIIKYYFIFYIIVYFFPPCRNFINEFEIICINVCLYNSPQFHLFETIVNNIIPTLTIVVFSIALLLRALRQKQRIHQPINWRRHRKMTIQLLSISLIYLAIACPYAFLIFLRLCGLSNDVGIRFEDYATFVRYYIILLFPFVSLFSVPELRLKIKKILQLRRSTRLIGPEILIKKDVRRNPVIIETIT